MDHSDAISLGAGGRIPANYGRLVGQWPQYQAQEGEPIELGPGMGPWVIVYYYMNDFGPAKVTSVHLTAERDTINKSLFPGHSVDERVQLTKLAAHLLFIQHHYRGNYRNQAIVRVNRHYGLEDATPLKDSPWIRVAMDELMQNGLAVYTKSRSIVMTPQGSTVAARLPGWADPMYFTYRRPEPDTFLAGVGSVTSNIGALFGVGVAAPQTDEHWMQRKVIPNKLGWAGVG